MQEHHLPVQRACRMVRLSRAAYYRPPQPRARADAPIIAALMAIVADHGRWGFWECVGRLRRLGHRWKHKRIPRVYCDLRLNLKRRTKRRVPHRLRRPLQAPPALNRTWALDVMSDALYDRRRFRVMTVLDEGNREALALAIGTSRPAALKSSPVGGNVRSGFWRLDDCPYQSIMGQQPVYCPLRILVRHDADKHRTELLEHAA